MSIVETKFKQRENVKISEVINIHEGSLLCDPQSGARISFSPKYLVNVTTEEGMSILDFEEAHYKYPWFFDEF